VHAVPPHGSANTPCCDRSPFDLPAADRITVNAAEVTCASADEGARQRPGPPGHRGAEQTAATLAYTARWIDAQPVRGDGPTRPTKPSEGVTPLEDLWAYIDQAEAYMDAQPTPGIKDSPDEAAELTRQADVARSLMARFAASPSTPADPRPTDPTGSEA